MNVIEKTFYAGSLRKQINPKKAKSPKLILLI